jgi:hypothetical protein
MWGLSLRLCLSSRQNFLHIVTISYEIRELRKWGGPDKDILKMGGNPLAILNGRLSPKFGSVPGKWMFVSLNSYIYSNSSNSMVQGPLWAVNNLVKKLPVFIESDSLLHAHRSPPVAEYYPKQDVFWAVAPSSVVARNRHFRGRCCFLASGFTAMKILCLSSGQF